MKKIVLIVFFVCGLVSNAQYRGTRQNAPLTRTETYVTNSPGNSASNSWLTGFDKDSLVIAYGYPAVQLWKFKSYRNDGYPTSIAWFDNDGYMKRSPLPSWLTSESDPLWMTDKTNYYDKTTSDARYLQNFTELDPQWNSVASNYRTKIQNDLLYVDNNRTVNGKVLSSDIVINKSDVGLSNVDNTSDLNKPINNATQTALNGKLSAEVDGSITNEIQSLSIAGNTISLSNGGGSVVVPASVYTAGTGINIASNVVTNTAPDQTVSITGAGGLVVSGTYPNLTATQYVPTDNIVTRTINSSTYTISSTKPAVVRYVIKITCTATIGSASSGKVVFQYSTNGGSSWIDGGELENSNTVTLAVVLNSTTTQTTSIVWNVPANALCRLVPTTSGTTTITWVRGQETY